MTQPIIRNITVVILLMFTVGGMIFGSFINTDDQPIIMLLIFLAATSGSVVNQTSADTSPIDNSFTITDQIVYFSWKALVAIVFSLFLYCAFASQLVTGDLFPSFSGLDDQYVGMVDFLNNVKVETNQDALKMLVWAFIAGYVEKFVPNIIQQMKGAS